MRTDEFERAREIGLDLDAGPRKQLARLIEAVADQSRDDRHFQLRRPVHGFDQQPCELAEMRALMQTGQIAPPVFDEVIDQLGDQASYPRLEATEPLGRQERIQELAIPPL